MPTPALVRHAVPCLVCCLGAVIAAPAAGDASAAATPAAAAAADAAPAAAGAADAAPVDAAPVDAAPVDAAPVDAAPVDAAPVDAAPVDAVPADAAAAGANGTHGVYRMELAEAAMPGAVTVTAAASLAVSRGMFAADDRDVQQQQALHVVWALPWVPGLELGVGQAAQLNDSSQYPGGAAIALGSPSLAAKYSQAPWAALPGLGLAARVELTLPTRLLGSGIDARALTAELRLAASLRALDWLVVGIDGGYVFDRHGRLDPGTLSPPQRLAAGLPASSRGTLAAGARARLAAGPVAYAPFVEISDAIVAGAPLREQPLRVTAGLRLQAAAAARFALLLGADARLAGAPRGNAHFAGVPPWAVFAQLALTTAAGAPPVVAPAPGAAAAARTAAAAQAEAAQAAAACAAEVARLQAHASFRATGHVRDRAGKPVPSATVFFSELPRVRAAVTADGAFTSPPLASVGPALQLRASAPGYVPAEMPVERGAADSEQAVELVLRQEPVPSRMAIITVTVVDAATGNTVDAAVVSVAPPRRHLPVVPSGALEGTFTPGTYTVEIVAPGYRRQVRQVRLTRGMRFIFNVTLQASGS